MRSSAESTQQYQLPRYVRWLYLFQAFNACNFTIALGAPMILTARYLGAGESAIGVLISLTPFLASIQMFSTGLADRWGYRKLMIAGWTTRSFMLLLAAPIPLFVGRASPGLLVFLFFLPLFAFNTLRGIAACAWFPWIKLLIPEKERGYFLGMEQRVINASSLVTMLAVGCILIGSPQSWRYSLVLGISWLAGMGSLFMLARVPDKRSSSHSNHRSRFNQLLPVIKQIWSHKPYRRIIRFGICFNFAFMAVPGFLVLYQRNQIGWTDGPIQILSSAMTLGVLLSAVLWGRMSDRFGSRPLMRLAMLGLMAILLFWILCASGVLEPNYYSVGVVYFFSGICFAAQFIPQIRLALASCPEQEATIGIMLYQVLNSFSGGLAPLLWGFSLRWMRGIEGWASATAVSYPFAILLCGSFLLLGMAQLLLSRIPEAKAVPTSRLLVQMIWGWPLRVLYGFTIGGSANKNRKNQG